MTGVISDDALQNQSNRIMKALRAATQQNSEGGDLRNIAASLTSQAQGGNYFDSMKKFSDQQTQRNIDAETGIYNQMKEQSARGNAEAKTIDDAITEVAGNDPKIYASILNDLHNDPEDINAANARGKVMKYAAERGITPLSVQKARSDLSRAQRESSGEDVGPTGNIIKKIAAERGIPFTEAAYLYQTGFRGGRQYDQAGNIVPIGGGLDTAASYKEAEKTGTLNAEIKGDLKKKGIQANNVLDLTKEAKTLLPKSSSGIMQGAATGIAKGAGISTESSRADARLKVIAAGLTASVPRMEGPQSDKDVALYKQAAADVANTSLPYEDRLAAVDTMEGLQLKYTNPTSPSGQKPTRLKYNPATGDFE